MNCLREARLVTAAMMMGVALAGAGSSGRCRKRRPRRSPDTDAAAPEQVWEGKLGVGAGLSLRIVVHVGKTAEGKLTAKMDSPDQGAKGLKVDTITLDKTTLSFEMKATAGQVRGQAERRGDRGGRHVDPGGQQPSADLEEDR